MVPEKAQWYELTGIDETIQLNLSFPPYNSDDQISTVFELSCSEARAAPILVQSHFVPCSHPTVPHYSIYEKAKDPRYVE